MIIRVKVQHFIERFMLAVTALLLLSGSSVANVVIEWNAIAVDAPPPTVAGPAHARILGYVHAAMYDAVNGVDRRQTLYALKAAAPAGASAEAAAAAAAHGVLARFYPAQQATLAPKAAPSVFAVPSGIACSDLASAASNVAFCAG